MRSDYGARALLYLAERHGEGPVQSAEIASHQSIPEAYLEQLMTVLRRAGLIRSVRGPAGGHLLARHPREIRMGEVVAIMEGPTPRLACCNETGCQAIPGCALEGLWRELEDATRVILDSVSLEELLARQDTAQQRAMYHI